MSVPISVKKHKYLEELKALTYRTSRATLTTYQKRVSLIELFEFLNTNGLRIFGFSGKEGDFTKMMLAKVDSMLVDLNKEVADGIVRLLNGSTRPVSKRILMLDKKLIRLLETSKQKVIAHRTGVLMALYSHFPQDIVREIAENYV